MTNTEQTEIRQIAQSYINRGWSVVPLIPRTKKNTDEGWDSHNYATADFARNNNIGVKLGAHSGGLIDVDCDAAEVVRLRKHALYCTDAIFGRRSKPNSHFLSYCKNAVAVKFIDPDTSKGQTACLIEIRTSHDKNGEFKTLQTVFPGSTHESGERVEWSKDGEPARIDFQTLKTRCASIAAQAVFVRCWHEGSRRDLTFAISGKAVREGWEIEKTLEFISDICSAAGDEETEKRLAAVRDTYTNFAAGESVTGFPTIVELIGEKRAKKVAEWLGFNSGASVVKTAATAAFDEAIAMPIRGDNRDDYEIGQDVALIISQIHIELNFSKRARNWFQNLAKLLSSYATNEALEMYDEYFADNSGVARETICKGRVAYISDVENIEVLNGRAVSFVEIIPGNYDSSGKYLPYRYRIGADSVELINQISAELKNKKFNDYQHRVNKIKKLVRDFVKEKFDELPAAEVAAARSTPNKKAGAKSVIKKQSLKKLASDLERICKQIKHTLEDSPELKIPLQMIEALGLASFVTELVTERGVLQTEESEDLETMRAAQQAEALGESMDTPLETATDNETVDQKNAVFTATHTQTEDYSCDLSSKPSEISNLQTVSNSPPPFNMPPQDADGFSPPDQLSQEKPFVLTPFPHGEDGFSRPRLSDPGYKK
jgi:hypothetical protein